MIDITFAQLQTWLVMFFWPFVRIAAFVMAAPIFGHSALTAQTKITLSAVLAIVVSMNLPPFPAIPMVSWAGFGVIIEQVIIGLGMALCMQIVFAVVQVAGEFIGLQMGLAFASFFSPDSGANTMIISQWLYIIALMFFLALDGHLLMIQVLDSSFTTLPIAVAGLDPSAYELVVRFSTVLFSSGLLLALPLITALLIINLTLGILNRAAPQFTVFSVGFPMSLVTGLILLTVLMTDLGGFLQSLYLTGLGFIEQFLAAAG